MIYVLPLTSERYLLQYYNKKINKKKKRKKKRGEKRKSYSFRGCLRGIIRRDKMHMMYQNDFLSYTM